MPGVPVRPLADPLGSASLTDLVVRRQQSRDAIEARALEALIIRVLDVKTRRQARAIARSRFDEEIEHLAQIAVFEAIGTFNLSACGSQSFEQWAWWSVKHAIEKHCAHGNSDVRLSYGAAKRKTKDSRREDFMPPVTFSREDLDAGSPWKRELDELERADSTPEALLESAQEEHLRRAAIERALSALTVDERELIVRTYGLLGAEPTPATELAAEKRIPRSTVQARLKKADEKFRRELRRAARPRQFTSFK